MFNQNNSLTLMLAVLKYDPVWVGRMSEMEMNSSEIAGLHCFYLKARILGVYSVLFLIFILYWSILDLQYCVSFRCNSRVIRLFIDIYVVFFRF